MKVYTGFEGSHGKYSPADFPGFSVAPSLCNNQGFFYGPES